MNWINVSTSIPPASYDAGTHMTSCGVLVAYTPDGNLKLRRVILAHVRYDKRNPNKWDWIANDRFGSCLRDGVTHWQHLPELPTTT
jgi:hypothetical protein